MNANEHKHCYGTMFPSARQGEVGRRIAGKAFWFELTRIEGMFGGHLVGVDIPQWDECRACPEFEDCYKLCLGQLALESAIADYDHR